MKLKPNFLNSLLTISGILSCFTTYFLYLFIKEHQVPNPNDVMLVILLDLVLLLGFGILLIRKFFLMFVKDKSIGFKIQRRIVLIFCISSAFPTVLISLFSIYFFHIGLQTWFDKKVTNALEQAFHISEAYIQDKTVEMKVTAFSMAEDFDSIDYTLINDDLDLLQKILIAQAEFGFLDEAIIFQSGTNKVLAQAAFSYSVIFSTISPDHIEKANKGEIVVLRDIPNKIRILVKLSSYNNTYLLVGRLLDEKIVKYIEKTHSAAERYSQLRQKIDSLRVKFFVIFMILAMLLIMISIISGIIVASKIANRLKSLLHGTKRVESGDLSIQIDSNQVDQDELTLLANAFNNMVKKLSQQRMELAIAQRAIVWADVAKKVAHEIKNPLTPIQLSAEMLLKKYRSSVSDSEVFERYINNILRNALDITSIVNEFSKFAQLPKPVFEEIDLVKLLKDIVEVRKEINFDIGYKFICDLSSYHFMCDKKQMHQMLNNVLKNSEIAMKEQVSNKKILVILEVQPRAVQIIIKDTGPGFSKNMINKLIEPYVTTRASGMGLGLSIVKKIAEEHFGEIKINNDKGGGAVTQLKFDFQKSK